MAKKRQEKNDIIIERHYANPDDRNAVNTMVENTAKAFMLLSEIIRKEGKEKLVS